MQPFVLQPRSLFVRQHLARRNDNGDQAAATGRASTAAQANAGCVDHDSTEDCEIAFYHDTECEPILHRASSSQWIFDSSEEFIDWPHSGEQQEIALGATCRGDLARKTTNDVSPVSSAVDIAAIARQPLCDTAPFIPHLTPSCYSTSFEEFSPRRDRHSNEGDDAAFLSTPCMPRELLMPDF